VHIGVCVNDARNDDLRGLNDLNRATARSAVLPEKPRRVPQGRAAPAQEAPGPRPSLTR
jgi:hypothetical protein